MQRCIQESSLSRSPQKPCPYAHRISSASRMYPRCCNKNDTGRIERDTGARCSPCSPVESGGQPACSRSASHLRRGSDSAREGACPSARGAREPRTSRTRAPLSPVAASASSALFPRADPSFFSSSYSSRWSLPLLPGLQTRF